MNAAKVNTWDQVLQDICNKCIGAEERYINEKIEEIYFHEKLSVEGEKDFVKRLAFFKVFVLLLAFLALE